MTLYDKWKESVVTVYDSQELSTLELLEDITSFTDEIAKGIDDTNDKIERELKDKTDINGDHKGSWQGLNRPTLSEEGMRSTVEKLDHELLTVTNDLIQVNTQLEQIEQKKANIDDVARISNGTPLFASSTSGMTDTTKNYVNTSDGYLYIFLNGSFIKSSVSYQATGIADNSVTREKVTDETLSMYPFQPRATLKHNKTNNVSVQILRNSIKRIELYNVDEKRKYFINHINRSNDGNNILTITIKNDLGLIVANIDQWNFNFSNGVEKVILKEQNNSGINGYIYIDFSILVGGSGYYGMEYNETGISQECLYSFKEPIEKKEFINLSLPSKLYGVVGQELNIYFDNIILCNNLNNYQMDVLCSYGMQQEERWTYIPTSVGEFSLTINVYKDGNILITGKTINIIIKDKTGTGDRKALFIGDSLTEYNQYINEIAVLFENDSCNIKLLGTKGWSERARHEGRSGWTTSNYLNNANINDVTNPFFNPTTSKFDFNYYLTNSNIETPDIVVIMLGTNDTAKGVGTTTTISNIKEMITSIKLVNANTKIGVALTTPPAYTQDGFGRMNLNGMTRFALKQLIHELDEKYIQEFDGRLTNVSVVPTNLNLDTINNFPYEEVVANSRTTSTVKRIKDNVHPSISGMNQIADTYYGWLKSFY